MPTITFCTY
jgi:hypothetical protein